MRCRDNAEYAVEEWVLAPVTHQNGATLKDDGVAAPVRWAV
jgi:hypothetical protein